MALRTKNTVSIELGGVPSQSIEPVPSAPRETEAHEQVRGVAFATTGVLREGTPPNSIRFDKDKSRLTAIGTRLL